MEWVLLKVVKLNCINKSGVKWSGYSKKMFITRTVLDRHVYFFTPTPLTPLDSTTPLGKIKKMRSPASPGNPSEPGWGERSYFFGGGIDLTEMTVNVIEEPHLTVSGICTRIMTVMTIMTVRKQKKKKADASPPPHQERAHALIEVFENLQSGQSLQSAPGESEAIFLFFGLGCDRGEGFV